MRKWKAPIWLAGIVATLILLPDLDSQPLNPITYTTTTPVTCGPRSVYLLTPNGTMYTCANGTPEALGTGSGGGGPIASFTVPVVAGTACIIVHGLGLATPYYPLWSCFNSAGPIIGIGLSAETTNGLTITDTNSETISCVMGGATGSTGAGGALGTIACGGNTISPTSTPTYTATQSVSTAFTCTGCTSASWSSTGLSGSGLSISGSGSSANLVGTAVAGTYAGVVISYGAVSTSPFTVTINAAPSTGTCGGTGPPSCPGATNGSAYGPEAVVVTGGTGTVTLNVTSGALPSGVTISAHTLTATNVTATAGTYNFDLAGTDANSVQGTPVAYSIVVTGGGGGGTFAHYYAITAGTVTGTLTNFPWCINTGNSSFSAGCAPLNIASSLNSSIVNTVTQSTGVSVVEPADAVLTATAPGGSTGAWTCPSTAYIPWETEAYSAGSWVVHVKPTSTATGGVVYICFGQSAMTTQQNTSGNSAAPASVWSAYSSVYHHANVSSALSLVDSTGNSNETATGSPTTFASLIDGGVAFNGSNELSFTNQVTSGNNLTISAWVNTSTTGIQVFVDQRNSGLTTGCILYMHNGSGAVEFFCVPSPVAGSGANFADGNWHYFVGTVNSSTITFYADGLSSTNSGTITPGASTVYIGENSFTGNIDEVRMSSATMTAAWVAAEYANQKISSTFLTAGSEQ
jgi:Concanavalin A-like lectin/glucanases superfamily